MIDHQNCLIPLEKLRTQRGIIRRTIKYLESLSPVIVKQTKSLDAEIGTMLESLHNSYIASLRQEWDLTTPEEMDASFKMPDSATKDFK